ncbi:triphosphoribosyl-dephospho-CoA synthase [Marinimicrococcus flavescens]|uniref:Triphosphoribosyl-dephospho-CoA synthase n=1 Tax=Marinimicrococcus flavescens TaxID=3031815 RepID=A0AAP3UXX5_9PROT|nr:triphosphoribosyl-dephospho-CoA synthase [Marinimicrococcus flavescens]
MSSRAGEIAGAFEAACRAELDALKPGNVHVHEAGHGMTVDDFLASAAVAAPALVQPAGGVGERLLRAVTATRERVGQNTNLGILLLCAPLVEAALRGGPLRETTCDVLRGLTVEDARHAFAAIRLAAPGGLGASPRHDVREEPRVTLAVAMAQAAARDRIAWNYANGLADIFETGMDALAAAQRRGDAAAWRTTALYLRFLAARPDTHIVRKHGLEVARGVQARARQAETLLCAAAGEGRAAGALLQFDAALKDQGINPGTTADLTVATLLAARLITLSTQ